MGQLFSAIGSNPEALQGMSKMGGGMMGGSGKGGEGAAGGRDKGKEDVSGGLPGAIGQFENAVGSLGSSEFEASKEYMKQRAQGLPETPEAKLQNVEPASSGWSNLLKAPEKQEATDADISTEPVKTEEEKPPFAMPSTEVKDDPLAGAAYSNALKSFLRS